MGVGTVSGTNILHKHHVIWPLQHRILWKQFSAPLLLQLFCHIDRHHALVEERRSSVGHVLSEELQSDDD